MDEKKTPDNLPGNQGQFGVNNATEDFRPLQNHDDGGSPAATAPASPEDKSSQGNPGPHQVQGGMRS